MSRFGIIYTVRPDWLVSCIVTGAYGEAQRAFEHPVGHDWIGDLRNLELEDRLFLNYGNTIMVGPLIVSMPHTNFSINTSRNNWHKVNCQQTIEPKPIWCVEKPWCIFFDKFLISQTKYIQLNNNIIHNFHLPNTRIGPIAENDGKRLWEFIEEKGGDFSDYIQRNKEFIFHGRNIFSVQSSIVNNSKRNDLISTHQHRTNDGRWVRSKSEKIISDFLYAHNIVNAYEKPIIIDTFIIKPDFYIPSCDLIIEHLGLLDNPRYQADWNWKESLYKREHKKYIFTTEIDIQNIDIILLRKLKDVGCIYS